MGAERYADMIQHGDLDTNRFVVLGHDQMILRGAAVVEEIGPVALEPDLFAQVVRDETILEEPLGDADGPGLVIVVPLNLRSTLDPGLPELAKVQALPRLHLQTG